MGWFSKAPAEPTKLTMEEIATIVIKDTEAFIGSPDHGSPELDYFSKIVDAKETWKSQTVEICYLISNQNSLDEQAIAARKALIDAFDQKSLFLQADDDSLEEEQVYALLDALVSSEAWDIKENDEDKYKKKTEVWAGTMAITHANIFGIHDTMQAY